MARVEIIQSDCSLRLATADHCQCNSLSGISACVDNEGLVSSASDVFTHAVRDPLFFSDPSSSGLTREIKARFQQKEAFCFSRDYFHVAFRWELGDVPFIVRQFEKHWRMNTDGRNAQLLFERFIAGEKDKLLVRLFVMSLAPDIREEALKRLRDPSSFGSVLVSISVEDASRLLSSLNSEKTVIHLLRGISNVARGVRILIALIARSSRRRRSELEGLLMDVPSPRYETQETYRARMLAVLYDQTQASQFELFTRDQFLSGLEIFYRSKRTPQDAERVLDYARQFGCYLEFNSSKRLITDVTCEGGELRLNGSAPVGLSSRDVIETAQKPLSVSNKVPTEESVRSKIEKIIAGGQIPEHIEEMEDFEAWAAAAAATFEDIEAESRVDLSPGEREITRLKKMTVSGVNIYLTAHKDIISVSLMEEISGGRYMYNWIYYRKEGTARLESVQSLGDTQKLVWKPGEGSGSMTLVSYAGGDTLPWPNSGIVSSPYENFSGFWSQNMEAASQYAP